MSEFEDKIELVQEHVSIFDLFDMSGLPIKYDSRTIPSQIACPFHGRDIHKSARVYPSSNSFHCWFCDKSWDVAAFWAQANEWWKPDGRLDYAKGVNDLMIRFKLRTIRPDWKTKLSKNLAKVRERRRGDDGVLMENRLRLKSFYANRAAKTARSFDSERKREKWTELSTMWDSLDAIDLERPTWRLQLTDWNERMRGVIIDDFAPS